MLICIRCYVCSGKITAPVVVYILQGLLIIGFSLYPGLRGERHHRNDHFFEMAGALHWGRHPRNDRFFEMEGALHSEQHPRNDRLYKMAGALRSERHPRNDRFFEIAGAWRREQHPRNDRFSKWRVPAAKDPNRAQNCHENIDRRS